MEIRVLSDLHIENTGFNIKTSKEDLNRIIILAGDIHEGKDNILNLLHDLSHKFLHVIYVLGNHDYYNQNIFHFHNELKNSIQNENIHILQNTKKCINDIEFIGSTLWSDCSQFINKEVSRLDFNMIFADGDEKISAKTLYNLFLENKEFIKNSTKEKAKKRIIITHHSPTLSSCHDDWKNHPINVFFHSNLDDLIKSSQADIWVHGHTHNGQDYFIEKTRVLCNPGGYLSEKNRDRGFNPELIINL